MVVGAGIAGLAAARALHDANVDVVVLEARDRIGDREACGLTPHRAPRYAAPMPLRDALLPELDQEMAGTRRTLERVPDAKLGWKPHPKSPTLGGLATHLANLPTWTKITLETTELDIAPQGAPPPRAAEKRSREELLAFFDANLAAARAALARASDADLHAGWTLLKGGERVFTLPRIAALRGFVLNHNVHHRAQLGVYLRLLDVPVPSLYGPTADEPGM